jgi:hypothetical protein
MFSGVTFIPNKMGIIGISDFQMCSPAVRSTDKGLGKT